MPIIDAKKAVRDATETDKRDVKRQSGKAAAADKDITPMSESKMLNLPRVATVCGLRLVLTCPVIAEALPIQERIFSTWPDSLLFAATGEMDGEGINPEIVLRVLNANKDDDEPEFTRQYIINEMMDFNLRLERRLPALCDSIWPIISATDDLHWPRPSAKDGEESLPLPEGVRYLDDALKAHFTPARFADLLRVILAGLGGYPGDAAERFL